MFGEIYEVLTLSRMTYFSRGWTEHDGVVRWYVNGACFSYDGYRKLIENLDKEIKALPLELKLTDPRDWVREWK
jgi:hypothetical protein